MARGQALTFDVSKLESLAGRLSLLSDTALATVTVNALNKVVDRTYELSIKKIVGGINLDDAYLRRRMTVERATKAKFKATITATGKREALTTLGRFNAAARIVANNGGRIRGRRGNAALGLPPGMRQKGVSVQVKRGSTKMIDKAWLMPLRSGTEAGGNGFGVFMRTASGLVKHRYGPSVYQLFDIQATRIAKDVGQDLETTMVTMVADEIRRTLSP